MKKANIYAVLILALVAGSSFAYPGFHGKFSIPPKRTQKAGFRQPPASFLKLPQDFHTEVFADNLGAARQLAVSKQGLVYVKLA
jgi:hypothetical protein